jgi:hypothetical protein
MEVVLERGTAKSKKNVIDSISGFGGHFTRREKDRF